MTVPAEISHKIRILLDRGGLDEALRAFPELLADHKEHKEDVRLLACKLAEPALQYSDDLRLAEALSTVRSYADGKATEEDRKRAYRLAHSAELVAITDAEKAVARAVQDAASDYSPYLIVGDVAYEARSAAFTHAEFYKGFYGGDGPTSWKAALAQQEHIVRNWLEGK